jgi:hypothetical protein
MTVPLYAIAIAVYLGIGIYLNFRDLLDAVSGEFVSKLTSDPEFQKAANVVGPTALALISSIVFMILFAACVAVWPFANFEWPRWGGGKK